MEYHRDKHQLRRVNKSYVEANNRINDRKQYKDFRQKFMASIAKEVIGSKKPSKAMALRQQRQMISLPSNLEGHQDSFSHLN